MWSDVAGPPPHPIFIHHGRPARAMIGYEGKPKQRYFAAIFGFPCSPLFCLGSDTGADLVEPTSLTSGDAPLSGRRVGAVAS